MTHNIVPPSIEEQLRAALVEVADFITVDPTPAAWPNGDFSRTRARTGRVLALAVVALVLAVGVGVGARLTTSRTEPRLRASEPARTSTTRSTTTSATPPSTKSSSVRFVDEGALTVPRTYRTGAISLLPPPSGAQPALTALDAFRQLTDHATLPWKGAAPTAHLVLALATISDFGPTNTNSTVTPFIDHRFAWVAIYTHVPSANIDDLGGAGPTGGVGLVTPASTEVSSTAGQSDYTFLVFIDAQSGAVLDSQGTTAS